MTRSARPVLADSRSGEALRVPEPEWVAASAMLRYSHWVADREGLSNEDFEAHRRTDAPAKPRLDQGEQQ